MISENASEYTIKQPDLKDILVQNEDESIEGMGTNGVTDAEIVIEKENTTKPTHDRQSWTMRLISSDSFNASMAVEYLNSIQDKPSLSFLGKRLFDLPVEDLDFYLPQLVYLYVTKVDAASVTHAYFENRHKNDAQFTILCIWFLNCFTKNVQNRYENHALMLKSLLSNSNNPSASNQVESMITLSLDRLEETNWTVGQYFTLNRIKY
uniref:PIK helical domain-containing protein n=1 Tax=Caenorhabditis tropicalis TaxID=1561998 RepID=A0A1I7SZV5_9PELO